LTNIAEALQKAPEISADIEKIYVMGGAVAIGGNVGNSGVGIRNDYAEWNIYIDPTAANIVFNSGIPVILVPLDATRDVPVTRKFYEGLGENRDTAAAKLVYDILTANLDFIDSGGFQFWDSLTAAIFTDEGLASFEDVELVVVEQEGPESGRTKLEPGGAKIKVASGTNRKQFEELFLTILNRGN
jgi:pyrimidine-specific ribonucleoside hydrolase